MLVSELRRVLESCQSSAKVSICANLRHAGEDFPDSAICRVRKDDTADISVCRTSVLITCSERIHEEDCTDVAGLKRMLVDCPDNAEIEIHAVTGYCATCDIVNITVTPDNVRITCVET